MSTGTGPALRVVNGDPTPEELAAVTALLAATGDDAVPAPPPARGGWNDPARRLRREHRPGPGGWAASAR